MKEEFEKHSYKNKEQILVYLDSFNNMGVFNSKDRTKSECSQDNVMQLQLAGDTILSISYMLLLPYAFQQ